jgi:acyl carrier protein
MGLDSANSVFLIVELEDRLGLELTPDVLFEHPTIGELARHLAQRISR